MSGAVTQFRQNSIMAVVVAVCVGVTGLFYLRLLLIEQQLAPAFQTPSFSGFVESHQREMNDYIERRINVYVAGQKQQRIDAKYEAYAGAQKTTQSGRHLYGAENARFTLVEFSDLECPYCKQYHESPKGVVDASNGLVNWQWKHMPLAFHDPVATIQANASECVSEIAGNRAFWVYLQQLFDETKGNGQGAGDLLGLARGIGVDEVQFTTCVQQGRYLNQVASDVALAHKMGLSSTPVTFIVDNQTGSQMMLKGLQKPEAIASAIQRMKKTGNELTMRERGKGSGR